MKVVLINGSPRKEGFTERLLAQVEKGVQFRGAKTQRIFLAHYKINFCQGCGEKVFGRKKNCWDRGKCLRYKDDLNSLSKKIEEANALVIGTPVYFLEMNGITKNFLDRLRLKTANGKPAFGITMAGGTGKGLITAAQSLYHYFFVVGFRAIPPLCVSKFNFKNSLQSAYKRGIELVKQAEKVVKFNNLAEQILWHEKLPFMQADLIDENLYLTELVIEAVREQSKNREEEKRFKKALRNFQVGKEKIQQGKKRRAVKYIYQAYREATSLWREI